MATFRSELGESYTVQVLEVPAGMDEQVESSSAVALLLLKRLTGALLAVPEGFFSEEALAVGLTAGAEDQVGQSTHVTVPAGEKLDLEGDLQPTPDPLLGEAVSLVLVDVTSDFLEFMVPFSFDIHDVDNLHCLQWAVPISFHLGRSWQKLLGSGFQIPVRESELLFTPLQRRRFQRCQMGNQHLWHLFQRGHLQPEEEHLPLPPEEHQKPLLQMVQRRPVLRWPAWLQLWKRWWTPFLG